MEGWVVGINDAKESFISTQSDSLQKGPWCVFDGEQRCQPSGSGNRDEDLCPELQRRLQGLQSHKPASGQGLERLAVTFAKALDGCAMTLPGKKELEEKDHPQLAPHPPKWTFLRKIPPVPRLKKECQVEARHFLQQVWS
ncbi:hypothetical protein E5288_WYG016136 [Bos mutus]|uniref:Uncharacterized protein n=1 Tax=Bos mutus TaxID=72004 RepID=A0A6B0RR56_9CETA|nr:hypothetical protein [Bos mutus]